MIYPQQFPIVLKQCALTIALYILVIGGAYAEPQNSPSEKNSLKAKLSGIDTQYIDEKIRQQDDFYKHINGLWLKNVEIPADKSRWGTFMILRENSQQQIHDIINQLSKDTTLQDGSVGKKIADMYNSFMDEATIQKAGLAPISVQLKQINDIHDKKQLAGLSAQFGTLGIASPFVIAIEQDNKNSSEMAVFFYQSGLGMPDRDYYLKSDMQLKAFKTKYLAHVEYILKLSGDKKAKVHAAQIVALETELAKAQWSNVENRDPVKTYNKYEVSQLNTLMPYFDWDGYLKGANLKDKVKTVIISQPSYLKAYDQILQKTPLSIWKSYLTWQVMNHYSPILPQAYADAQFDFYGKTLRGTLTQEERWKRAVNLVEGSLGEGLGEVYVKQHFSPEKKAQMETLVQNLLLAYKNSIQGLDWMGAETKLAAQKKLETMVVKIGYPNKWRDYSALAVSKNQLIANQMRSAQFEYAYNLNKLDQPVDRTEWHMTPQTVNAYYNPLNNEIAFPAAILQPPFFDASADDAVNYGAIGAVIGHEISHGFDDQGSQFDELGNMRDWWTAEDKVNFKKKTKALVEQYSRYEPVKGYHVNGELTLGENIADNSGLAIAYKAYQLSLAGKKAPIIDGMSGDQRFYAGWAQAWRGKVREALAIEYLKTDPHSPNDVRANATLLNQTPFYDAYEVKEGDQMYLVPKNRVVIW